MRRCLILKILDIISIGIRNICKEEFEFVKKNKNRIKVIWSKDISKKNKTRIKI